MYFIRSFIVFIFFFIFVLVPQEVLAETTQYRSAGWVGTQTSLNNYYQNLTGCQATDGIYCEHPFAPGGMSLYFSSFGTLSDFGIPQGSTIHKIHIKVTGRNNVTQWVQVGQGKDKPLTSLCQNQNMFDMWKVYLGSTDSFWETHTTFTPFSSGGNNLGQCFSASAINAQNFTLSLFFNGYYIDQWYAYIDNFEIAFDYTLPATPTPTSAPTATPTATPTPTPTAVPTPEPFLDLPWDYEEDFSDVALKINSYFDHTYPLLSIGLEEPLDFLNQITTYQNEDSNEKSYSRHDGYDYGRRANAKLGDPVLAAGAGWATYVNTCGACGNAIHIDHENGYQTRYYHLQNDGLITVIPNQPVWVENRQVIGKVGFTGNVDPDGEEGAHIHFMVIEDKNKDGNFNDNIPDGVTDPFGWQSEEPDPWENYSFFYNAEQRTGNKSYYLWTTMIPNLKEGLPSNGGIFNLGKATVTFSDDPTRPFLNLDMRYSPYANSSATLVGVTPTIDIVAKNLLGDIVKVFPEYITIKIDFSDVDLSRFDLGKTTFSIYSSDDQGNWIKEPTIIDLTGKTATTQVNHLTYFALMAERIDTIAPVTSAEVHGEKGQDNWYRSDIEVSLIAQDNEEGLGVAYTLYKKEGEDWQIYTDPLTFTTEGDHTISFYSVDNDDNIEELKVMTFLIDKTPPEAEITYDIGSFDIRVTGKDASESATVTTQPSFLNPKFTIYDQAGNTLRITTDKIKLSKQVLLSINSLQYNTDPVRKLENNLFFTLVIPDKNRNIKQIDQYYSLKDDKKIFTKYVATTDITQIYTKTPRVVGYTRENKEGIVLLKLSTQNGTLRYSY